MDQRSTLKTLAKANKTATEAHKILVEAYGDKALSFRTTCRWISAFKSGREETSDERGKASIRTARTMENIKLVENILNEDRRKTVEEVASESGLSHGTVQRILQDDLRLKKYSARWIPRLLDDGHKEAHLKFARQFKKDHFQQGRAFLDKFVTQDETWICYYTPELKSQSSEWLPAGSDPPKKAKSCPSTKKLMLSIFWDSEGIIYQHWVARGQTIYSKYHCNVLQSFRDHMRRKRPDKYKNGYVLHLDNARVHTSKETTEFMAKAGIKTYPHPPYSPDLAPSDFYLFPKLKKQLAGLRFVSDQEVKSQTEGVLQELSKNGLMEAFEAWSKRCDKCIEMQGSYVEK